MSEPYDQNAPTSSYHGQPQNNTQPIVINSQQPQNVIINVNTNLYRTKSVFVTCPNCKVSGNTRVETSCSVSNTLCYICFDPLIWLIFQLVRSKDINCCNATHYCGSCGGFMATYNAC